MYGTIAMTKVKPGRETAVQEWMERWWTDRRPNVAGARASYLYRSDSDPSQLMVAVVFDSKEQYRANAEDPEQDRWFRELAENFEGEPQWMDGDILAGYQA